ncbi:hypothetical protein niasHT_016640 [Heterodera trifolii]|uniref:BTB domain-containing protein n=1 Tax=Heterodera trifolii TaxID=157864 RepID=A0ABD2LJ25_9BILA
MSQSVLDRMKHLLSTGEDADVYFLVGDGDEKELLSAHKFILKLASEVFAAMFRFDAKNEKTEFASANCPVEIIDVEAAAFKVMLSFIYTSELAELNGDNAMAVLYAAKKYNIPGLVDASLQISISELRNVFLAYAQAGLYEMEDYCNDCLSYIDKNADTLLKSDEFLQIDQKLLCEILDRDDLQIHEEIAIWEASLRWADEKCRENGIEFSAENRRAVLGPALFKIRFPRLSNEEFSKKIVPSDVLSNDEVIAIYQFNSLPNYHGISNGLFPMPFPTNGRISDRKEGTLLMDIEKVPEFAREKVGRSRFSEKVYINGMPWKILAQIKTKNGRSTDNNQKWLGIFFWCDTSKKDSNWRCCVRSATFRIISQKIEAVNSVGTLSNFVVDNKLTNLGFPNFVSFAQLMDPEKGFYNKTENKVTLAIDIIVEEPKTEKILSDPNKSNGTISMEIEKVPEFARQIVLSERKSETVHIKGFLWKILAQINPKNGSTDNDEKWLGIFLICAASKEDQNWSCKCSTTFRIVSQKNGVPDFGGELNDNIFDNKENGLGYANFISFTELMDPEKGFYDKSEDKVTLVIDINVKEAKMEDKS